MDKQTLSARDDGRTQRTVPGRMPWIFWNSPAEVRPRRKQLAAGSRQRATASIGHLGNQSIRKSRRTAGSLQQAAGRRQSI